MSARSDEGMWLLSDPPRQHLKSRYQFELTDEWLNRAIKGSVRFNNGGSGGFVSADGLIVTNHHIAADALQKLSTPSRDLYRDGFYAAKRADELSCPDLELNVLQSIEDVTDRLSAAVTSDMTPSQAFAARRAAMSQIEKESLEKTGLRSDVVTLYQGGLYHLYRYKKYTDVRLVMAPEHGIAFFGGDTDNFEYPRFNLDVAFFRAYENGQPASTPQFFRWSATGPVENDIVFVTGHPGTTNRLETLAKLQSRRDSTLPYWLARLRAMEAALSQYGERGPEQHRQAATDHHRVANARKAMSGQYQGLLNPAILKTKAEEEETLAQPFIAKLKPAAATGRLDLRYPTSPWGTIGRIQQGYREFEREHALLESGHAFFSELFGIARHCVRMADELPRPSAERLREYRDSNLDSLKFQLFSPAPIYPALERNKLAASLTFLAENLGGDHPTTKLVLAGKNPITRAAELIEDTKLMDVAERKRLVEGGKQAIEASPDSMIQLARAIDPESRKFRKRFDEEVDEPERQAYAEIAKMRFQVLGRSVAPDATFTLRLAFGVVQGYSAEGETYGPWTTFGQAFEKSDRLLGKEPFDLPRRWREGKDKLDLGTPFNFVSTADTIGGNSGSPVLNRAGELVGINFDRNRFGLVRNFVYTDVQARHIAVHSRGVLEALRKLYGCEALLQELLGK